MSTTIIHDYQVIFVDVNKELVNLINSEGWMLMPKIYIHLFAPKPNEPAISTANKRIKKREKIKACA